MPRKKLPEEEKLKQVQFMTPTKKVTAIGYERCQEIASKAVDAHYDSLTAPKGVKQ